MASAYTAIIPYQHFNRTHYIHNSYIASPGARVNTGELRAPSHLTGEGRDEERINPTCLL